MKVTVLTSKTINQDGAPLLQFKCESTLSTFEFSVWLDADMHNDGSPRYLAERITALFADVARHAATDAIAATVNRVGVMLTEESERKREEEFYENASAPDPVTQAVNKMLAAVESNNYRADVRAVYAALITENPHYPMNSAAVCAITAARMLGDTLSGKIPAPAEAASEPAPAPGQTFDDEYRALVAIRAAARAYQQHVRNYNFTSNSVDRMKQMNARDELFKLLE